MVQQALDTDPLQAVPAAVPEPGQLVEVRRRQWVVSDVHGAGLQSGPRQHLVTLASLDDDALGEELQAVWQLEPGAQILEKAGMPRITGHDTPDRLEAFLDAVRWGATTNADRSFLQAPFRSGIAIEDYQLDPLVRAIDMARVSLLIADDVGLGKTIEAGLVVQELLVRHRARTVFVICPASLQMKWQTEMWEKFGLEFRIVDTEYVRQLRRERGIHANPWSSFPRLITSMDWMKSGEGLRLMRDCLPPRITYPRKFDILIVDEAHNVAPATASKYAVESQRTRLVQTVAPHFEHRMFLTATPHNGYQSSFTSLLELLDDQRFTRSIMPNDAQLRRVMVRRLKADIVDADGNAVYPKRCLEPLEVAYSDEEREVHALLREFTRSRTASMQGTPYEYGTAFIHKLLKKRLFSSPMAFATTIAKHRETLTSPRKTRGHLTLDDLVLRKAILQAEEDHSDDGSAEAAELDAIETASNLAAPLTPAQKEMMAKLIAWSEGAKYRPNSKSEAIIDWLKDHLKPGGTWNSKRVILFTEYRATHTWLEQILASHGYGGCRLMTLHGGLTQIEREPIKAAFQAHPDISLVRILLATDAASEGIDLQNHCNYLIHVEVPWNPNVMEQRNGRIDRHGQRQREVFVYHPMPHGIDLGKIRQMIAAGTDGPVDLSSIDGEAEYLARAIVKIDQMRADIGVVGPVIAGQIEEGMAGSRSRINTHDAEAKAKIVRRFVTEEKQLQEKIARLHGRLMETKTDFHLSPEHMQRAVTVALVLAEKPPLRPVSLPGVRNGGVYEVPPLSGSWGRATAGLEHPHTGQRRPITFDHEVAKGRDDVVLAHLNHRLVQMCLRLLREELWRLDDVKRLHRVAFRGVEDSATQVPVVAVWARLVVTGGDHHRLHEEVILSGGELKHHSFARIPQVGRMQSLVDSGQPLVPPGRVFELLADRFRRHEAAVQAAVEVRSRERLRYLGNALQRRMESEKEDIEAVLSELERTIRSELEGGDILLPGFLDALAAVERDQVHRDKAALQTRLARIPEEKAAEAAAITKRYDGLTDRVFPVAVVFLVPRSQVGGAV